MISKLIRATLIIVVLTTSISAFSQKKPTAKYPSLFWEITGNGLKKSSYLFGTMHVSSKMVFHLSDSFFSAIKSVDAVALELNPDLWQPEMVDLSKMNQDYISYTKEHRSEYLTESSFKLQPYDDELKTALSTEPAVVNSLLYRTYSSRQDFEEGTFLDLYIFQTGRRLGKRAAGVEDYYETEKIVMDAYAEMSAEKKKKTIDIGNESISDINEKIQNAYRRGDLDLMDSLDVLIEKSDVFREKFLYKRNEIQANSIDTILKTSSLFVGVGAAHLAGNRGVIELLRKKGYKLRPIKMLDDEALQKDTIDKLKVPVTFKQDKSDDGFFTVKVPGPLYKIVSRGSYLNREQYADMSNGSYYMVTRVKTFAAFKGQSTQLVMKKLDSILYENIAGKILKKEIISRNGYMGYDITNKTSRGDEQRFNIFITPYEVLIFKMGGKDTYIEGSEAAQFFSSIQLKENNNNSIIFSPKQGGFSVKFPQAPSATLNTITTDDIDRWEYESVDSATGDDYLIFKKSVYNFNFLEEDSFDVKLIEESFHSAEIFDKQLSRKLSSFNGYPCLDMKEKMKDGSIVNARCIIKGHDYYVVAARSKNLKKDFSGYFSSFHFTPYQYKDNSVFTDTSFHFVVTTSVAPNLDGSYRAALEKMANRSLYDSYENEKDKYAWFQDDSTGEAISVSVETYPKYYSISDSLKYWSKKGMADSYAKRGLLLYNSDSFELKGGISGMSVTVRDTGSSRTITGLFVLKGNHIFRVLTIGDTLTQQSDFVHSFFKTFNPQQKDLGRSVFQNCTDSFFVDLFSKDSVTHAAAKKAITSRDINFTENDIPKITNAISRLKADDKDYYEIKEQLIYQLGSIDDSTKHTVVPMLKKIYEQTTDTSTFQNEVLLALTEHKTADATLLFKELILQDPPVYDNDYRYSTLFNNLKDSLSLSTVLFPEILQLVTLDDYKGPVTSLLVKLVDSGYVKADKYETEFSKIYFDAKIELKKQQEKEQSEKEKKAAEEEDDNDYHQYSNHNDELDGYAVLLMPFYDKNPNVPKFFAKLLASSDGSLQMNTALLMIKNNKTVSDSLFISLAANDQYCSSLYYRLEKRKRLDRFPVKYKTQFNIVKSDLISSQNYSLDSFIFLYKEHATYKGKNGVVYLFKYRVKKTDGWKIAICGIQPDDLMEINADDKLIEMTDISLKTDEPQRVQVEKQLHKILFTAHPSADKFYENDKDYRFKKSLDY